jgi:hypothetical protein
LLTIFITCDLIYLNHVRGFVRVKTQIPLIANFDSITKSFLNEENDSSSIGNSGVAPLIEVKLVLLTLLFELVGRVDG